MEKLCAVCGDLFEAKRPHARYCGDTCRKRAARNPNVVEDAETPDATPPGEVATATATRIADLDVATLPQAALALALARRVDSARETGAAVAALAKQLVVLLDELERRGRREVNPLDELRARRENKRAS